MVISASQFNSLIDKGFDKNKRLTDTEMSQINEFRRSQGKSRLRSLGEGRGFNIRGGFSVGVQTGKIDPRIALARERASPTPRSGVFAQKPTRIDPMIALAQEKAKQQAKPTRIDPMIALAQERERRVIGGLSKLRFQRDKPLAIESTRARIGQESVNILNRSKNKEVPTKSRRFIERLMEFPKSTFRGTGKISAETIRRVNLARAELKKFKPIGAAEKLSPIRADDISILKAVINAKKGQRVTKKQTEALGRVESRLSRADKYLKD